MPETRIIRAFALDGTELPQEPYEVSDEQLADEAEVNALAKADQLIDAISNLADAKVFLKRLCARLVKKGLLS